jgi:cytochrome c556
MSKIKAMANMGMGALYIAGSEESIGDMKTRAKAEIFTDKDGVKEVAVKFNQAAKRVTINAVKSNHHLPQPSLKPSGGILNTTHG